MEKYVKTDSEGYLIANSDTQLDGFKKVVIPDSWEYDFNANYKHYRIDSNNTLLKPQNTPGTKEQHEIGELNSEMDAMDNKLKDAKQTMSRLDSILPQVKALTAVVGQCMALLGKIKAQSKTVPNSLANDPIKSASTNPKLSSVAPQLNK